MNRWTRGLLAGGLATLLGVMPVAAQTEATLEPSPSTLRLWFPDVLSPNGAAPDVQLTTLIADFQAANPDIQIDLRLKREGDAGLPGTLLHSLRSARTIAPGTLPHLTLMRQSELAAAVRDGLLMTTPESSAATTVDGLLPAAVGLGVVEGERYGLPLVVDVLHQAYQPDLTPPADWTFDALLGANWRFTFPAGQAAPASSVLIAQVAAADGLDADGRLAPAPDALISIYQFYADALAAGLLPPDILSFDDPVDYLTLLASGELPAGVVSASAYLNLRAQGTELLAAPLPTMSGDPTSLLNGWLWVLPAGTPEERALALRFVAWINEPNRLAAYAAAVNQIPAQSAGFAQWAAGDYGAFLTALLTSGPLPPGDLASGQSALARSLQAGLVEVLSGGTSAAQAAQRALGAGS